MKKIFFTLLFLGLCFSATSQNEPKVGDNLIIKAPNTTNYTYLKFPRLNILMKRGIATNYDKVTNVHVIVDKVITKNNGITYVILKKKDGTNFFRSITKVKANYAKALEAGEIAITK